MQQKLYYHIKQNPQKNTSDLQLRLLPLDSLYPPPKTAKSARDGFRNKEESRSYEVWFWFPSNQTLHPIYSIIPPTTKTSFLNSVQAFSIMITIVSIVLTGGEVNMAALGWLCQEAGGGREYWLMLICFASMLWCVSIGSQGPGIRAAVLGLPLWFELNPHPAAADMMLRPLLTPDPCLALQHCRASLYISSWPSQDCECNRRWQTTVTTSQRGHCC